MKSLAIVFVLFTLITRTRYHITKNSADKGQSLFYIRFRVLIGATRASESTGLGKPLYLSAAKLINILIASKEIANYF